MPRHRVDTSRSAVGAAGAVAVAGASRTAGGGFGGVAVGGVLVGSVAIAHVLPAGTWLPWLRRTFAPALCGPGAADHLALTFDDGPGAASTPLFLDELDRLRVRATFFCVGEQAQRHPDIVRDAAARGHEIAVHGWYHRNRLLRPGPVGAELQEARDLLAALAGTMPRWYRPPYGVLTGQALAATRRAELTPVLWSVWAKDWTAGVTADDVLRVLTPGLRGGATVLLHDTDTYAQPGSWKATLEALPRIVTVARERGLRVGPLREHGAVRAGR